MAFFKQLPLLQLNHFLNQNIFTFRVEIAFLSRIAIAIENWPVSKKKKKNQSLSNISVVICISDGIIVIYLWILISR